MIAFEFQRLGKEFVETPLAVAAALPGGDPLAAALAAGETPSPELVAEAGETQGLNPAVALVCLAAFVIGLVLTLFTAARTQITSAWERATSGNSRELMLPAIHVSLPRTCKWAANATSCSTV